MIDRRLIVITAWLACCATARSEPATTQPTTRPSTQPAAKPAPGTPAAPERIQVTSLDDSGPGTLRDAIRRANRSRANCRIIGMPGEIVLSTPLTVTGVDNVGIVGNGMTLRRCGLTFDHCRYIGVGNLRIVLERWIDGQAGDLDCFRLRDSQHVRVHNCTLVGGTDACLQIWQDCDDVVMSYCLIGDAGHAWSEKTDSAARTRSQSCIVGGDGYRGHCTLQFCAIGESQSCNPAFYASTGQLDLVNCMLGCSDFDGVTGPNVVEIHDDSPGDSKGPHVNLVANFFIAGTKNSRTNRPIRLDSIDVPASIHASGNLGYLFDLTDPWAQVMDGRDPKKQPPRDLMRAEPWPLDVEPITALAAVAEIYAHVGPDLRSDIDWAVIERMFGD